MASRTKDILRRTLKSIIFPVIVIAFFGIATGGRTLTSRSILVVLRQSVMPAIICMAMMPNLMLGMIDFSAGAVVTTSAIIGTNLMKMTGTGIPGMLFFCILVAVLMTTLTGFLNNKLRVPVLVLTIGLVLVYEAFPKLFFRDGALIDLRYATLAMQPWAFIVFAVAFAAFYVLVNLTTYGHNIRALGGNDELAARAGLNVDRIKQLGFTLSGLFLGIAGALYMASSGQIRVPSALSSMTTIFDAFLGLFLGMFLSRFCNIAIGLPLAVITMTVMSNGLVAMGLDASIRDIVKSFVLLALLAVSGNQIYLIKWRANNLRSKQAEEAYRSESLQQQSPQD